MSIANSTRQTMPTTRAEKLQTIESEIESHMENGMEAFYHVGMKLKEIRDDHLYKEAGFDSFEIYGKERFELSKPRLYQLIQAAEYRARLPPSTTGRLQWSERSIRELTRIPLDEAPRVGKKIMDRVEKEEGAKLTSSFVRKVVDEELGTKRGGQKREDGIDGIDPAQYMRWKAAALEAAVENLQCFDEDAWRLLRRKSLEEIESLISACKALAAFLESVRHAEDPRPPEASSEPYAFHRTPGKTSLSAVVVLAGTLEWEALVALETVVDMMLTGKTGEDFIRRILTLTKDDLQKLQTWIKKKLESKPSP